MHRDAPADNQFAVVRDPSDSRPATLEARARPMAERLERALAWNAVAAELREGLAASRRA